jgi:hypothetical protein
MQPGYGGPDDRANSDGDKQEENNLVKPIE